MPPRRRHRGGQRRHLVGVLTEHYEDLEAFGDVFETNVLAMAYTFHPFIARMRRAAAAARW